MFHEAHFSSAAQDSFQQEFLTPNTTNRPSDGQAEEYWEEEDDLGYYEDGVKRTLTDEQIEIFRHSELRELERAKERASKRPKPDSVSEEDETHAQQKTVTSGKTKKNKKRQKQARREPKPDLRKRTWDVVEAGVDSLDYD